MKGSGRGRRAASVTLPACCLLPLQNQFVARPRRRRLPRSILADFTFFATLLLTAQLLLYGFKVQLEQLQLLPVACLSSFCSCNVQQLQQRAVQPRLVCIVCFYLNESRRQHVVRVRVLSVCVACHKCAIGMSKELCIDF